MSLLGQVDNQKSDIETAFSNSMIKGIALPSNQNPYQQPTGGFQFGQVPSQTLNPSTHIQKPNPTDSSDLEYSQMRQFYDLQAQLPTNTGQAQSQMHSSHPMHQINPSSLSLQHESSHVIYSLYSYNTLHKHSFIHY